jgi:hypothetical protein
MKCSLCEDCGWVCDGRTCSIANDVRHDQTQNRMITDRIQRSVRHIKPNVSPRTHERYGQIALKNIAPLIGAKLLLKLKPIEISEAYSTALESGRRDGKGGLSPRTVHHMHRVLFPALDQAERWKMVPTNPAALLEKKDRPKIERKTVATIDPDATAHAMEAARKRRLFIPLVLGALSTAT